MAYSDFTITKFEQAFGIRQTLGELFPKPLREIEPSERLITILEDAQRIPLFSEKAKSELLISPILLEMIRRNEFTITLFSGYSFDIDPTRGLNGQCDFLLGTEIGSLTIKAPVFCIVEAKSRGLEEGIGQCAAELYAARLFNETSQRSTPHLYGVVTDGYEWLFVQLIEQTLIVDFKRYSLGQLGQLLGILQTIIDFHRPVK